MRAWNDARCDAFLFEISARRCSTGLRTGLIRIESLDAGGGGGRLAPRPGGRGGGDNFLLVSPHWGWGSWGVGGGGGEALPTRMSRVFDADLSQRGTCTVDKGRFLRVRDQDGRALRFFERDVPRDGGLGCVGGADRRQAGN